MESKLYQDTKSISGKYGSRYSSSNNEEVNNHHKSSRNITSGITA